MINASRLWKAVFCSSPSLYAIVELGDTFGARQGAWVSLCYFWPVISAHLNGWRSVPILLSIGWGI